LTTKMLASTVQFSNNTPPTTHTHHTPAAHNRAHAQFDGRWHRPETTTTPSKQENPLTGGRVVLSGPNRMFPSPHHHHRAVPLHTRGRPSEDDPTRAVLETTPGTGGVICQCLRH
jgi:hypothetical protein